MDDEEQNAKLLEKDTQVFVLSPMFVSLSRRVPDFTSYSLVLSTKFPVIKGGIGGLTMKHWLEQKLLVMKPAIKS